VRELPGPFNIALGILALLGGVAVASSFVLSSFFTNAPFLILALFAVMCSPISVPFGARVRLSMLHVFVLAAVLLAGTSEGVLVATIGALSAVLVTQPRVRFHQAVAMVTGYPLEAVVAGWAFLLSGGEPGEFTKVSSLVSLLFASLVYYLAHTLISATLVGFEERTTVLVVWFDRYAWTLPSFLSAGAVAGLVGMLEEWAGLHAFVILVPFVLLLFQHYRLRAERDREREFFRREMDRQREGGLPPEGASGPPGARRAGVNDLDPVGSGGEAEARYVSNDCPPEGVRRRWYTRQLARLTPPSTPGH
jgi:hypothetical protein